MTTFLDHATVRLALHELRGGDGPTLLLLHALADRTPDDGAAPTCADWPGPVSASTSPATAQSTVPAGGGYTSEVLMADADVALAHLGPCTILGRGLGAYIALTIAGARPDLVRGAVLDDGAGLAGGGDEPRARSTCSPPHGPDGTAPDPYALAELQPLTSAPADYATLYVRLAVQASRPPRTHHRQRRQLGSAVHEPAPSARHAADVRPSTPVDRHSASPRHRRAAAADGPTARPSGVTPRAGRTPAGRGRLVGGPRICDVGRFRAGSPDRRATESGPVRRVCRVVTSGRRLRSRRSGVPGVDAAALELRGRA